MPKFKDLSGQRFGRLTVFKVDHKQQSGNRERYYWLCKCDCGNTHIARTDVLTSGLAKSCGYLHKEQAIINVSKHHKHKMSGTPIYSKWQGMRERCLDKSCNCYSRYGGRGIKIHEPWITDFQAFYDYVSNLPNFGRNNYSLDRIDNNGNYEPGNLRWASIKTQCRNRRSNIIVNYQGKNMTLIEAAEKSGLSYGCLISRLKHNIKGRDLFKPCGRFRKYSVNLNNTVYSFKEIAKIAGTSLSTIYQRHRAGKRGADLFKPCEHRGKRSDNERLNVTVERSE